VEKMLAFIYSEAYKLGVKKDVFIPAIKENT
jgi:hypothetical protein